MPPGQTTFAVQGAGLPCVGRIKELEERLAKDSRTSSKPPSSDGLARLPRHSRRPSGKQPGGQAGHVGRTLVLVEQTDEVVSPRPAVCQQCGQDLSAVVGRVVERRQVLDLPAMRLLVHEHQLDAIGCPQCSATSLDHFPAVVSAPVQYGPHLQALAVYLRPVAIAPHRAHLRSARRDLWVPPLGSNGGAVERTGR